MMGMCQKNISQSFLGLVPVIFKLYENFSHEVYFWAGRAAEITGYKR